MNGYKKIKKLKIYLDTSVLNFINADDSPDLKLITEDFFTNYVDKDTPWRCFMKKNKNSIPKALEEVWEWKEKVYQDIKNKNFKERKSYYNSGLKSAVKIAVN